MQISKQEITSMPYVDFVAFINQWNTLPGSYVTLSKWAAFSQMSSDSRVLEVACTTGFTSRELATMTNCTATGFDLSGESVSMAKYNHERYAPNARLSYQQGNGLDIVLPSKFTHVAVGASLGFFPDPAVMVNRCVDWLEDGGYLLASPFYSVKPVPKALVEHCKKVFGITVTTQSYDEILAPYRSFETLFEERNQIVPESPNELHSYCTATIDRACEIRGITSSEVRNAAYDRLLEIKKASNQLREYQNYSVLVLRYRSTVYPHRFAELF